jgi:hypothetical protein
MNDREQRRYDRLTRVQTFGRENAAGAELATMLAEDERPAVIRGQGKASEWLRTAKGSVQVAGGESTEAARMAKYGPRR